MALIGQGIVTSNIGKSRELIVKCNMKLRADEISMQVEYKSNRPNMTRGMAKINTSIRTGFLLWHSNCTMVICI